MAKILYGVAGEGMGHAIRSKAVILHLLKQGHKIHIITGNRAYVFLKKEFEKNKNIKITEVFSFTLAYKKNSIKRIRTILANIDLGELNKSIRLVKKIIKEETPDLIISDYETITARSANFFQKSKIPVISIDNEHIYSCTKVDKKNHFKDFVLAKILNQLIEPKKNVQKYIVTTFFYPKITDKKTVLIPSILRKEILDAKKRMSKLDFKKIELNKKNKNKDITKHVLVYQTTTTNHKMFNILKKSAKEKFIIYGFNQEKQEDNLLFKKFSEKEFISDLTCAKAVIVNGGFTVISESIFLGKPILSIPIKKHFEQTCNAIYVEKLGFGVFLKKLNIKKLDEFLKKIPLFEKNLEAYNQKDNSEAFRLIDSEIKNALNSAQKSK